MIVEPEKPSSNEVYSYGKKSTSKAIVVIAIWVIIILCIAIAFSNG